MINGFVKIYNCYFLWSTVKEAPLQSFGNLRALKLWWSKNGWPSKEPFKDKLKRLEETGSSYLDDMTPDEVFEYNRAGPFECHLTKRQLFRAYILELPIVIDHELWILTQAGWRRKKGMCANIGSNSRITPSRIRKSK